MESPNEVTNFGNERNLQQNSSQHISSGITSGSSNVHSVSVKTDEKSASPKQQRKSQDNF